ncbi:hypothetical protein [Paraburkholderia elongata]|uniref:Uncharacterized protein n=1 Tax=Paraburkholderia elongata TaxID=2675747 RepID=A0A972NWF6_9BURK|nr:hypothetical protein [Paraburkholderia elongata]NPT59057.1 hypothetical protein [Paraburkholderia elongata]
MGTRSLTFVTTSDGEKLVNMYRQFDGYPSGHGAALFEFMKDMKIINGISGEKAGEAANGAGCLSAQMIAHFKDGIGGIYIYPVEAADVGQDYTYHVIVTNKAFGSDAEPGIAVKVDSYSGTLFEGNVKDFGEFCAKEEA